MRVRSGEELIQGWRFSVVDDDLVTIFSCIGEGFGAVGTSVLRWNCAPARPCPGDFDDNGDVDLADLAVLLAHFGEQDGEGTQIGDVDGDSVVTLADLALLLRDFGARCE